MKVWVVTSYYGDILRAVFSRKEDAANWTEKTETTEGIECTVTELQLDGETLWRENYERLLPGFFNYCYHQAKPYSKYDREQWRCLKDGLNYMGIPI